MGKNSHSDSNRGHRFQGPKWLTTTLWEYFVPTSQRRRDVLEDLRLIPFFYSLNLKPFLDVIEFPVCRDRRSQICTGILTQWAISIILPYAVDPWIQGNSTTTHSHITWIIVILRWGSPISVFIIGAYDVLLVFRGISPTPYWGLEPPLHRFFVGSVSSLGDCWVEEMVKLRGVFAESSILNMAHWAGVYQTPAI